MKFKNWTIIALTALALTLPLSAQNPYATSSKIRPGQLKARVGRKAPQLTFNQIQSLAKKQKTLPLWFYGLTSPRDGNPYTGVMVGNEPGKSNSGEADIPTQIVPFIIITHRIVTSINPDGSFNTVPGDTVFDPTVADSSCLMPPNDVPLPLVEQSPVFQSTNFTMGGTDVGTTQYGDAFQRANFWNVIKRNKYHVLLKPVTTLQPILLDIPAESGVAIPPDFFDPPLCGPVGIVDSLTIDSRIDNDILPALYFQGVDSSTFPIFLMYNGFTSVGPPALYNCCYIGFSGFNNLQTYMFATFQNLGAPVPQGNSDIEPIAAAVGDWIDDPYAYNYAPAWGQTGSCSTLYRAGQPLNGTDLPLVTMPNGFSYHLPELTFFNWFFGGPSVGVNGWYSDNGTFDTDAGPVCQP